MLKPSLSQDARRLVLSTHSARLRGTDSVSFRDDSPKISSIDASNFTSSGSVQCLRVPSHLVVIDLPVS